MFVILQLRRDFVAVGQFSGLGTKAIPEPGSTMILIGMGTVLLIRRRR